MGKIGLSLEKHKILFLIATSFFWFSIYSYVPELSTYAEGLGASYKMVGLIGGAYGLTQMLLRIPLGISSDRLRLRKPFIIAGILVSILSCMVTFINPSISSLFVTRLLAGVSAATWVAFTILFSSYFNDNEATKAMGIINSFNAVGQLSAMIIGGIIASIFGTRYLFLLGGFGGIIALILAFGIKETKVENTNGMKFKDIIEVIKNKNLIFISFLAILSQIITFATILGFVPIIAKNIGISSLGLSLLSAVAIMPGIFMAPFVGTYLVKQWGKSKTIICGFLISSITCFIVPFVTRIAVLYVLQFFSGVGRNMVFPLLMGLGIKDVSGKKRATAMGFFQSMYGIGIMLGPIILGYIGEKYNLTTGFISIGCLGVFSMGLTKWYYKHEAWNKE